MNRTLQPEIQELVQFNILPPVRTVMPNGVPLTIINAGEQDVVRVDIFVWRRTMATITKTAGIICQSHVT